MVISKLPNIGTTIFSTMSALAKQHNAINLSQGFPDFKCNPLLLQLAEKYMREGYNQYAPMQGCIQLRETIAEIIHKLYSYKFSPDSEITVTAGATQGIYTAITAFLSAGEEAIIFEPAYDCYAPAIELQSGIPVYCRLKSPNFKVDWTEVEEKINSKTKLIIINSPHNPSGSTFSKEDMAALEKIVSGKNIIVISDEVYEHMVFDGEVHESAARYPNLMRQSIIVSSFGKTVHTTGWKIGYVAAPEYLMSEFRKVHQFLVFAVNHPFQLALAEFLKDECNYTSIHAFYEKKRDHFLYLIKKSRFKPLKTNGTYFQLLKYNEISDERDSDFAIRLTTEKKLAAIPLSAFYKDKIDDKILRFCFAKKDETLEKAAEIINKL
jgi:methionine transaminase